VNESVQYHHRHDGDSCHGHIDQVTLADLGSVNVNESVQYHPHHDGDSCHGHVDQLPIADVSGGGVHVDQSLHPPSWVHVFSKSTEPSSIRTQAVSIAYIETQVHKLDSKPIDNIVGFKILCCTSSDAPLSFDFLQCRR
jgi:hypothetical protein